jgi:uncharacterized membrane protein
VDVLAALAYLGGPLAGMPFLLSHVGCFADRSGVTALVLLILETVNDYVRFHGRHPPRIPSFNKSDCSSPVAYQSALLTTPLLVVWMLMRLIGFWGWLRYVHLLSIISNQR